MAQCVACKFYPGDCGYWDKEKRKGNASYLHQEANHNCQDFDGIIEGYRIFRREGKQKCLTQLK